MGASEYIVWMESASIGGLVKVAGGGPELDGIVYDVPSRTKVIVAVVDGGRGPVLRSVHPKTLSERTQEGPDDHALRLLIRRTPPPLRGSSSGAAGIGHDSRGHTRGTMHRTTGR
jgi:hypothetical protein